MQQTIKKERIQYIDALRGFTMLLVVFAHVETFSFQYMDSATFLGEFFKLFRMPLFFFISGFITYRQEGEWTLKQTGILVAKKLRIQLLPTLIFGLLYTYICLNQDFVYFFTLIYKAGYWFTIALLEMFLMYYIIRLICEKIRVLRNYNLLLILLSSITLYIINTITPLTQPGYNIASFSLTARYFVFFALGMIIANYKDTFFKVLDSGKAMLAILTAFIVLLIVYTNNGYGSNLPLADITGLTALVIVFAFFRKYASSFDSSTKLGKSLQYIGKRTLDIYLLHYFILPKNLTSIGDFFLDGTNIVLEFFVVIFFSTLVVGVCLLLSNTLRLSSTVAKYLFGVRS